MCGIIAFAGTTPDAGKKTFHALCALEYRGYDSWGIAVRGNKLSGMKAVGKISGIKESALGHLVGTHAIGHTRWATHGGVTEANAHPQWNSTETIAVIHNGIIENHDELRAFLRQETGVADAKRFRSETDTEVVPHLIDYFFTKGETPETAFHLAIKKLKGRFTIVALFQDSPAIFAARSGSPLVIGIASGGTALASDVQALPAETVEINLVGDREYVSITPTHYVIKTIDGGVRVPEHREPIVIEKRAVSKEGHPHFMLKEIMEERETIDHALRQNDEDLRIAVGILKGKKIFFTGCGTAGKMASVGQYAFAEIAGVHAQAFVSSEHALYLPLVDKKSVIIPISQSGETADVLEALHEFKKRGAHIIPVLNAHSTSMERMGDHTLFIRSGPERAVASTKAATGQMTILLLLAYAYAGKLAEGKHALRHGADKIRAWVNAELSHEMKRIASVFLNDEHCYIVGRSVHAPIAHEAAIKIQEVAYLHAEGFAGGELKHGPLALIAPGTKCIAFLPHDKTKADMEGTVAELKARGAWVLGISPSPHKLFDEWVEVPDAGPLAPVASIIPIQLLAYHLGLLRGNDPDMPRNLAKSVTVK